MPITWTPSPADASLRRATFLRPAYDCGPYGRDCKHDEKGDHGQHCDEWFYVVGDGPHALGLGVSAGNFPRGKSRPPEGSRLHFHGPRSEREEDIQLGASGAECEYIEAGRCFGSTWFDLAEEVFAATGAPSFEQPESFWLDLERRFREHLADYTAAIAAAPHRCATCGGTGLVAK